MWDGRVEQGAGGLQALNGALLPPGLSSVLAAQALLPLASRIEMRGSGPNEIATLPDTAYQAIYDALAARLQVLPGYASLFQAAYPGLPTDSFNIVRAANAIAAFIGSTWQTGGTPFDRYLLGDTAALTEPARRGALLFFGRAGCARCHRGPLLTDQAFHNTGIPVLLSQGQPDLGRAAITGLDDDRYRFRTPPLRNVSLTPPFMHNGSLRTVAEVVAHYADPGQSLRGFDPSRLDPRLQSALDLSPARLDDVLSHLDTILALPRPLKDLDQAELVQFLDALTDPGSTILVGDIPGSVPSGLPVFDH
jgi:cytochrome c peroxidase